MFMPRDKEPTKMTGQAKKMPPPFMAPKVVMGAKGKGKKPPPKRGYRG